MSGLQSAIERWLSVALCLGTLQGVAGGAPAAPPLSVIQIPIEFDLSPLFAAADSSLPSQAGHWPDWRTWHGIETRYRAWRGPLRLGMQGPVLQGQAHVRYQAEARKRLIGGIEVSAGCGVKEPPRQALIGVLVRLDWRPDWFLHPRFRVLPTRFLDRCEVTVADIDVSPLLGRIFEDRLETTIKDAMRALGPRLQHLRGETERAWRDLQAPREITPGLWLKLHPVSLALAPLQGSGARVETALWLALQVELAGRDGAKVLAPTPLPPLVPFRPLQPGLEFALELTLDYPAISSALSERLHGHALDIQGRRASLSGLTLAGRGEDLLLTAVLSGDVAGRLQIIARPGFDAVAQSFKLGEVEFVFDAEDLDLSVAADLFYNRIRDRIESEANRLLAERTAAMQAALSAALAQGLPRDMSPDLSGVRITRLSIQVGKGGLAMSGSASGALALRPQMLH